MQPRYLLNFYFTFIKPTSNPDSFQTEHQGSVRGQLEHQSKKQKKSMCVPLSFSDLQHYRVVSVPVGKDTRDPGAALPGSDPCVSRGQGAHQRRHRSHAVPEGYHQRDASVSHLF